MDSTVYDILVYGNKTLQHSVVEDTRQGKPRHPILSIQKEKRKYSPDCAGRSRFKYLISTLLSRLHLTNPPPLDANTEEKVKGVQPGEHMVDTRGLLRTNSEERVGGGALSTITRTGTEF